MTIPSTATMATTTRMMSRIFTWLSSFRDADVAP
jgi:hypothetical protein